MDNFKIPDIKWSKILKILGLVLLGVLVLGVFINLIVDPLFSNKTKYSSSMMVGLGATSQSGYAPSYNSANSYSEVKLSSRNIVMEDSASDGYSVDAESYEVTDYNATIETRNLKRDCSLIQDLKSKEYIIFQSANIGDKNCNFNFKVDKENLSEVLDVIKGLNPRDLSENVQSIKRQLEDFTSQEEILKNKQATIEDTLKSAVSAYNEITDLATKTNNADSLAKVIESKINIIERLTLERININAELDRLSQSKADQLERLKYVNFYVYVYENKIVDGQQIRDFWKSSSKQFVNNTNQLLNDLSLGLASLILSLVKYLIYALLFLIVFKLCWKLGVKILKK